LKTLLVTGGAGFIGSNFIQYVLNLDPDVQVINLDALTYAGHLENLENIKGDSRHTFVHGDIRDQKLVEELLLKHKVNNIVHFAAESHVDRSILAPGEFIDTNIVGTYRLLEAAKNVYINEKALPVDNFRFHHISTDEVFGALGPNDPPFNEETPYAPNSPYAAAKASSDHLVRAYFKTYQLPIVITNCSNNYGPFQYPEKLIPLMIMNALSRKPLPIYGDGQQIRDWLYVEDHCSAIWLVLNEGRLGETYAIGGDTQHPNIEIVKTLCAILDELVDNNKENSCANLITFVKDRPGHDWRYDITFRKLNQELGWKPKETLESGLRKTAQWYLDNQPWVDSVTSKSEHSSWITKNYKNREEVKK
jgi:dTDP-glucose 4,6-dehydratase